MKNLVVPSNRAGGLPVASSGAGRSSNTLSHKGAKTSKHLQRGVERVQSNIVIKAIST